MSAITVHRLDDAGAARWDAFVDATPSATFFHRAGWQRVIGQAFGHRCYYVYAERDGEICGVLPLVHVNSRIFSNGLISNAFGVYGGPAVSEPAAAAALDAYAVDLMHQVGADFLEYRCRERRRADWPCKDDLYVTFRRPIDPSADANLKAIPRKQRAVVRKALKAGQLTDVLDDDIERLHHVYATSVRNLGTPVFSKRYFRLLKEVFDRDCEVLIVNGPEGRPVAAVMSFFFRDEVLPYYGGGTAEARRYGANDFMYWRVMERSRERGCRLFDFGRSKAGTGSYSFKKNWGFAPEPLHYEFNLRDGGEIPDVNPLNPKYRLFIALWKRLPLPLANAFGPFIVRNLG